MRLSLLAPDGSPVLVAEVTKTGEPRLYVGQPDKGTTAVLTRRYLELWSGGNAVAILASGHDGGYAELCDGDGKTLTKLP